MTVLEDAFNQAVLAVDAGDVERLQGLLDTNPSSRSTGLQG